MTLQEKTIKEMSSTGILLAEKGLTKQSDCILKECEALLIAIEIISAMNEKQFMYFYRLYQKGVNKRKVDPSQLKIKL